MKINKPFLKGTLIGLIAYLSLNLLAFLLSLPLLLGYYFAIVFALIGGLISLLINKRKITK